ncbi:MAG: hypothetical protein AAB336_04910 [Acidobacteriota bacterium]
MKKRNLTPKNEKIRREQDPIPWRYCLLTLVCGLLLVVGFFWAARQHFSAMDFGIKNAKLRQQKESLESEQRLLDRNREVSLSPSEIKKVAKKLGLQDLTADSIEVISSVKNTFTSSEATSKKALVTKTAKVEKTDNQKQSEATKIEEKAKESKPQITTPTDLRERTVKK